MEYIIINGELYHHGTKGMRWGIRRYQNKDGSLTPAGKKRYNKELEKLKQEKRALKNQERTKAKLKKLNDLQDEVDALKKTKTSKKTAEEEAKKIEDEARAKEEYEAGKQQALKSGSASEVLKYKGDLTKAEMDAAWSRIQWEQNMRGASANEISAGKAKADKIFDKIDTVTNYATTGIKAYNTVANVVNAFTGTKSISLPKIDSNNTSGNKDTRKKEKEEREKRKKEKEQEEREKRKKEKEKEKEK